MARALVQTGRKPRCGSRQRRMKNEPTVGGVVMSDQNDGSPGMRIARRGNYVPGAPVWQRAAIASAARRSPWEADGRSKLASSQIALCQPLATGG